MKSIKHHILEKLKVTNRVSKQFDTTIAEKAMEFVNISNFKAKDADNFLFATHMNNCEVLCTAIQETNPGVNVMTTPEYYAMTTGKGFGELGVAKKVNYFDKNGHIVILNKFDEVEQNIFIAAGKSDLGVIYMSSIPFFEGIYISIDIYGKDYRILDSETVKTLAYDINNLVPPGKNDFFQGYDVEFGGQKLTTAYYLPSTIIEEA